MTPETLPGAEIAPLASPAEAHACAGWLLASEPWITLRRSRDWAQALLTDPARETHVARDADGVAGFVVLDLRGMLSGYVQTVCVRPGRRGQGIGSALMDFAEARIGAVSPNVFLCVSSFNAAARRLYERRGYEVVGTLRAFIVPEHDEILMRKTLGPWSSFRPR
ncbi:MAG TPA: GNAT family N-acetyltransferase [Pelomicrobium sp.]|nr:GNAT family N-acetyltransferase [Pelomicrobium sp.]